uniref:HTH gntR-type domain-containing protein n=1 Tax=Steinernema glaseri TaxID=37863 RepID=A0A1I7YD31_9BILA
MPSVRQLMDKHKISASTIFQAYYRLEAQGLIKARPRSGYYVCSSLAPHTLEADTASQPPLQATSVNNSDLIMAILQSSSERSVAPVDDLTQGHAPLRRQIALRYLAQGMAINANDIVITNGALEALNLCLAAVTQPGDIVLVESPTFYAALQSLERMKLQALEVPTHPREGIDLEALEQAIKQHAPKACWLMTNFQNPLGSLMPDAKKSQLVGLLARYDIPLIEDDVYGELYFDTERPRPAKAFDRQGLVMHCSSFSKTLAPGYRIGWAVPGRYLREVAQAKLTTTLTSPVPTQLALASYLEKGAYDQHLRRLRTQLKNQYGQFSKALGRHFPAGTRATRPEGGYFLWVELEKSVQTLELHRQALSQGISLAPGSIFSTSQNYSHCLRLNFGHPWTEHSTFEVDEASQCVTHFVDMSLYPDWVGVPQLRLARFTQDSLELSTRDPVMVAGTLGVGTLLWHRAEPV